MKSTLHKIATGILICTMGMTSCEVNRIPETDITDPSFWQNEADLKMGTNRLYTYLPGLPAPTMYGRTMRTEPITTLSAMAPGSCPEPTAFTKISMP